LLSEALKLTFIGDVNMSVKNIKMCLFNTLLLVLLSSSVYAIERRKSQFHTDLGYMIVPAPYSIPGIGQGLMLYGSGNNLADTYIDIFGYTFTGDAQGAGLGISDLHLISETLIFSVGGENITRATVMNYNKRGMETEKDEFNFLEASDINGYYADLTMSFFDRKLEVYADYFFQAVKLDRVRDSEGEIIVDIDNPEPQAIKNYEYGILIDYTDDRQDPRVGFRLKASRMQSPSEKEFDPEFYSVDYNATGFIPIGKVSTFALNVFRSDAVVIREGETDKSKISAKLGMPCESLANATLRQECVQSRDELVDNTWAANKYGTATSLGGRSRLRAYPGSRFIGAHALFLGSEFRWNLTDEFTPFDLWVMKDIRTAIQFAFFYELGSVSDSISELGNQTRESYGSGFRIVTGSGLVYRIDVAFGDEGSAVTMIADYPW